MERGQGRPDPAPVLHHETTQFTTRATKMASQCRKTCRETHPYEPEKWCEGCTYDESEDREENMQRWRQAEMRREAVQRWEAKFAARETAQ